MAKGNRGGKRSNNGGIKKILVLVLQIKTVKQLQCK